MRKSICKKLKWAAGSVLAILSFLAGRKLLSENKEKNTKTKEEEIAEKCEKKRNDTVSRIAASPARDLAENYGTVCDSITDGKLRFRKRIESLCNSGDGDNSGETDGNL